MASAVAVLTRSSDPRKKFKVVVTDGARRRTIHFGQAGASDYTQHRDPERRRRYRERHAAREDWDDPFTAGFWAAHALWGETTLIASLAAISRRYRVAIHFGSRAFVGPQ